jgi:hypothetical protein
MIPLLVQLGLALAGGIAQKVAADKQHEKDLRKHNANTVQDIMNKRASRAGDSMYMQQAISGAESRPEAPKSPLPGVVAGMGSALLGYNGGSADAAAGGASERAAWTASHGGDSYRKDPWDNDPWGDGGF